MDIGVVSARYARALLKFACQQKEEDRVYTEMETLAASYLEVPELRRALDNPGYDAEQKARVLRQAAGGKVSESTTRFLNLVLKEHRESFLQFMALNYVTLYRELKKVVRVALTTAVPLMEHEEEMLRELVEHKSHEHVDFLSKVDAGLIGGFILDYDTYRLDASVAGELRRISQQLEVGSVVGV